MSTASALIFGDVAAGLLHGQAPDHDEHLLAVRRQ
jgi:hypothetical protein